jgi:hypothetical protein
MKLVTTKSKHGFLALLALALILTLPCSPAFSKTYYHITVKAFLEPHDPNIAEWAWVTLVEIPKKQAYPREAAMAERLGGSLRGSVLGLVRAEAWRSSHSYSLDKRCKDRPAEMVKSWSESWGDGVYAQGGHDNPNDMNEINFGFTTRPILRENGRWFDPMSRAYVVAGPPAVAGSPAIKMKGSYKLRAVNHQDPLLHYEFCGRRWVKQYRSPISNFHINDVFLEGGNDIFGTKPFGPGDRNHFVYQIIRSTSREHPHWKRQEM